MFTSGDARLHDGGSWKVATPIVHFLLQLLDAVVIRNSPKTALALASTLPNCSFQTLYENNRIRRRREYPEAAKLQRAAPAHHRIVRPSPPNSAEKQSGLPSADATQKDLDAWKRMMRAYSSYAELCPDSVQ